MFSGHLYGEFSVTLQAKLKSYEGGMLFNACFFGMRMLFEGARMLFNNGVGGIWRGLGACH